MFNVQSSSTLSALDLRIGVWTQYPGSRGVGICTSGVGTSIDEQSLFGVPGSRPPFAPPPSSEKRNESAHLPVTRFHLRASTFIVHPSDEAPITGLQERGAAAQFARGSRELERRRRVGWGQPSLFDDNFGVGPESHSP